MPDSKFIKALDDKGRTRIMEIDLMSGEILNSKLMRKTKSKKSINVSDDFLLGVSFK